MNKQTLSEITSNFLHELKSAQKGHTTSLRFITHQIPKYSLVKDDEIFQALVIGGSVCKSARLQKQNSIIKIIEQREIPQPNFASASIFLKFIEEQIDKNCHLIGLNFAYPLKPVFENGKLDGLLERGTKEHLFANLTDEKVGTTIENYFQKRYNRKLSVSVANDTICLLLSGRTLYPWQTVAAGIVGTGLNFAIYLNETTLVNLEAANFDKFELSKTGKLIDEQSANASSALFEKETSGAYLFQQYNLLITEQNLNQSKISSTEELNQLAKNNTHPGNSLARKLLARSAQLVACQIGGITRFYNHDTTFIMEGSLFWKGKNYKTTVETWVQKLAPKQRVNFVEISESGIYGAAKLVS